MSDGKPYLRPAGLLWGRDAREAAGEKRAGRLAGADIAFTAVEVALRHELTVSRRWHAYRDLAASGDREIRQALERIAAPRPAVAGIDLDRPVLMGIVNVTPDSFSDGGRHPEPEAAIAHALQLAADGARILDVGGESTRPGSDPTPEDVEAARAIPVVEALAARGHLVSIDTRKPAVMRAAAQRGARILNDITALTYRADSLPSARDLGLPVILMHALGDPRTMQDDPTYDDVALDIFDYLEERIAACEAAGIARERLIADPGIGFGKTHGHNIELMAHVGLFHGLGVPLCIGASRKGFIGKLSGIAEASRRGPASVGAALAAAQQGAQIIRVHDVAQTWAALSVWRACATGDEPPRAGATADIHRQRYSP